MTTEPPIEAGVEPEQVRAVADAAELLRSLGHEVEEAAPPWAGGGGKQLFDAFAAVFGASISLSVAYAAMVGGRVPSEQTVEPLTLEIYRRSQELTSVGYQMAVAALQRYGREVVSFIAGYDLLLTPALAERPVPIGEIDPHSDRPLDAFARSGRFTPFTAIFNATGQPAISLPLFHGADGLPVGVQLVGQPVGEGQLLALSAQLEAARPWADRLPSL